MGRRLAARRHRHTAIRLFEREHVVNAVTCHGNCAARLFERLDKLPLLLWRDAPKDSIRLYGFINRLVRRQRPRVDIVVRIFDTGFFGNLADCERVVARDDLYLYALLVKVRERFRCVLTDRVGQQNERKRRNGAVSGPPSAVPA